jgi:uncharacterized protein (TIGR02246 family)
MNRVLLIVVLATLAARAPDCGLESADVREIRAVVEGIIDADNTRDLERVLGYYCENAVLMPPGESAVVGREAFRPRYESLFAEFDPEIELRVDEACVADGIGFVRGRNGGRLVGRTTGDVRELDDAFLMLLRREADGKWRISHLVWHRASREAPPDGE